MHYKSIDSDKSLQIQVWGMQNNAGRLVKNNSTFTQPALFRFVSVKYQFIVIKKGIFGANLHGTQAA